MNNKYAGVSVSNIVSIFFEGQMISCYNTNSVLFMKSPNSVYSLSLAVKQMAILPVWGDFYDDEKISIHPYHPFW